MEPNDCGMNEEEARLWARILCKLSGSGYWRAQIHPEFDPAVWGPFSPWVIVYQEVWGEESSLMLTMTVQIARCIDCLLPPFLDKGVE